MAHGEFAWNELLTRDMERAKAFYAERPRLGVRHVRGRRPPVLGGEDGRRRGRRHRHGRARAGEHDAGLLAEHGRGRRRRRGGRDGSRAGRRDHRAAARRAEHRPFRGDARPDGAVDRHAAERTASRKTQKKVTRWPRSVRLIDSTLRDGSHAMAHQFTSEMVRNIVQGAGRRRRRHDRDFARRWPGRVVVQLRLLEGAGVRPDQGRGRDGDEVEAGGAAAARHRHARGPLQVERVRREHGAHRHALHRGRRLGAAQRGFAPGWCERRCRCFPHHVRRSPRRRR